MSMHPHVTHLNYAFILVWQFSKPAHHRQGILEKWKFSSKTSWKNGNFSQFYIGKMEILKLRSLEKWKF